MSVIKTSNKSCTDFSTDLPLEVKNKIKLTNLIKQRYNTTQHTQTERTRTAANNLYNQKYTSRASINIVNKIECLQGFSLDRDMIRKLLK